MAIYYGLFGSHSGKGVFSRRLPTFRRVLRWYKSGTCWDLEEEEIAINRDDIYGTLEDDSNPNSCSYNNDFANLIRNTSPPAGSHGLQAVL